MMKKIIQLVSGPINNFRYFFYDFKQAIYYSAILDNTEDKSKARIMLAMHSLEKGLAFMDKKQNWGGEKAIYLTRLLKKHIITYGKCEVIIVALNVLNAYLYDKYSTKDVTIRTEINQLLKKNNSDLKPSRGGVKVVTYPEYKINYNDILQFYKARSSIRNFSIRPIADEEIAKAKQIARTTPTACNRQTSRIHVFKNNEEIKKILDNQWGDQGWGNNADTLFIITSDLSYFGDTYERSQAYIDGGMFAMNFVMGLHAQKIASCFKMYIREPKIEKKFKKLTQIPQQEVPIVLILAGHYLDSTLSPISYKIEI